MSSGPRDLGCLWRALDLDSQCLALPPSNSLSGVWGAVDLPQGLSQESKGRASTLRAVLCHRVRERDVLVPRVVVIMSAQKGLGHHPGQPSHLATESDPRGDRGLPKVTGQVRGRAEAKTQASCPSASVWSPSTLVT